MYICVCADRLINRYISLNCPTTLIKTDFSYSEKLGAFLVIVRDILLGQFNISERESKKRRTRAPKVRC